MRQLNLGGAQRQLLELVRNLDTTRFRPTVMALYPGGEFATELAGLPGVSYVCLEKRGRWDCAGFLVRLFKEMWRLRPRVVQGYVGVCNLLALTVKMVAPSARVVWSIRSADIDIAGQDWFFRVCFHLERTLSRYPDLIIANSQAGKTFYASNGFPAPKIQVISNGIDTDRFRPDAAARTRVREAWKVEGREKLIGIVGRVNPEKDHPTFIRAAALLAGRRRDTRFVVIGRGPAEYEREMQNLIRNIGVESRFIWAGHMHDMPGAYNALDILSSTSSTEGFSNAICEAMACGVPCVVTNVGDSATIVGDTGVVVTPGRPEALAEAWSELLSIPHGALAELGLRARSRIESRCRREALIEQTVSALDGLL